MKKNYIQPKTGTTVIGSVGLMQAASPVGLIQGVHTPMEWATGGASADDGV